MTSSMSDALPNIRGASKAPRPAPLIMTGPNYDAALRRIELLLALPGDTKLSLSPSFLVCDLQSIILPHAWVTEASLDAWLYWLNDLTGVHTNPASTYRNIASIDKDKRISKRQPLLDLEEQLRVDQPNAAAGLSLLPILDNEHWVLVVFRRKERICQVFDSLNRGERAVHNRLKNWLNSLATEVEWQVSSVQSPEQNDLSAGGTWTCIMAWCVVRGQNPADIASELTSGYVRQLVGIFLTQGMDLIAPKFDLDGELATNIWESLSLDDELLDTVLKQSGRTIISQNMTVDDLKDVQIMANAEEPDLGLAGDIGTNVVEAWEDYLTLMSWGSEVVTIVRTIQTAADDSFIQEFLRIAKSGKELMILLSDVEEKHWVLLCASPADKKLTVYDPGDQKPIQHYTDVITDRGRYWIGDSWVEPEWDVELAEGCKGRGENSSALLTCVNAWAYLHKMLTPEVAAETDARNYSRLIATRLARLYALEKTPLPVFIATVAEEE